MKVAPVHRTVNHLSEVQVLRFLIQFTLLFVTARILADTMKRLGQATVIGELLAGIIFGPSILGHLAPAAYRLLFPPDPLADHLLEAVSWIGVIMLLLYTGMETDLDIVSGLGEASVRISLMGIVIPWLCGFFLGEKLPAAYLVNPAHRQIFALFIAVAMSISAMPVIAKILIDLDLMRRDLGLMILAAGVLDDTIGWLMLSVIAGLSMHGRLNVTSALSTLAAVAAFILCCYYVLAGWLVRLMRWLDDHGLAEHAGMSAMVGVAMVCAILTQAIGIHAVFGAFVAGLMLGRSARLRKTDRNELEAAAIGVFAPIFFAYSGLKVDFFALNGAGLLGTFLAIAVLGKLLGCGGAALSEGLGWRESAAVAVGLNARGGMEIIVALIGLNLGVLTQGVYAIIIVVAIVTSMMTPPLLAWLLAGVERRPEEAERLEREKLLARMPFTKEGAKLLVLAGQGPNTQLAAHLAAAVGNHHDATITVFHATAEESNGAGADGFDAQFARIKEVAELGGVHNVLARKGSAQSLAEAIVKESERGYDAIFAGASGSDGEATETTDLLREVIKEVKAPVIIARDSGAPLPLRRVLAPTTGASFSRMGAMVAMLYGNSTGAAMTTLYVREGAAVSWRSMYTSVTAPDDAGPTANELHAMAQQLDVKVETRIVAGGKPEKVIVNEARKGDFDLLIMGALLRPTEEQMYFGPKVENILREARCAVAVVAFPERLPPA
jgi:Kef-type K+ transport system membrane component KefB/nucleotide-binding universal stress UspA family protein